MQVFRWGTSLAVRLPSSVVDVLDLRHGDDIEIEVAVPRRLVVESAGVDEVVMRLRQFRGRLPADFKFDRLQANER